MLTSYRETSIYLPPSNKQKAEQFEALLSAAVPATTPPLTEKKN
jgi:hypothetical protein